MMKDRFVFSRFYVFLFCFGFLGSGVVSVIYSWEPYRPELMSNNFPAGLKPLDHLVPVGPGEVKKEEHYLIRYSFTHYLLKPPGNTGSFELVLSKDRSFCMLIKNDDKKNYTKIEPKFAARLYHLWLNVLYETRYYNGTSFGLDGSDFYFSAFEQGVGWLHGKSWSPDGEYPTTYIVEVAKMLYNYPELSEDERKSTRKKIDQLIEKTWGYYRKHSIR